MREVIREAVLRWVPISEMRPAPAFEAQREIRQHRVDHLVSHFDLEEMGNPTLSYRDGVYWILDGNHRIEALKALGFGEDKVECWVYEGLTLAKEAERFLKLNDTLTVDTFTKFRVGVRAGRTEEVEIDEVATSLGLKVTQARVPGRVAAVAALRRVYRNIGVEGLARTLTIIRDAFGDAGYEASIVAGIGEVLARYGSSVNDEEFIKKLGAMPRGSKGLIQKGYEYQLDTGKAKWVCVGAAAVDVYNKGTTRAAKLANWWK